MIWLRRIVASAAAIIFAGFWVLGVSREYWGTQAADPAHSYGVRFKGGRTLYFEEWLGWFLDHALWILLALLIVAGIVECVIRRQDQEA
jgi:hypothetical protein